MDPVIVEVLSHFFVGLASHAALTVITELKKGADGKKAAELEAAQRKIEAAKSIEELFDAEVVRAARQLKTDQKSMTLLGELLSQDEILIRDFGIWVVEFAREPEKADEKQKAILERVKISAVKAGVSWGELEPVLKVLFRRILLNVGKEYGSYLDRFDHREMVVGIGRLTSDMAWVKGFLKTHSLVSPVKTKRAEEILSDEIWDMPDRPENPSILLNPRYAAVEFEEKIRANECATLEEWTRDKAAVSIRLFTGPGGIGKTRLFIQCTEDLRDEGWAAGFLRDENSKEDAEVLLSSAKDVFAVVDYAESRRNILEFLESVAAGKKTRKGKLRIALVARGAADWWTGYKEHSSSDLREMLTHYEPLPVTSVASERKGRQEVFRLAWKRFAELREKKGTPPTVDLTDDRFGRVLYIHMAALAAVEGLPVNAKTLLDEIVTHEKRLWTKRYKEEHKKDVYEALDFERRAARAMAAVTLRGGVETEEEAGELKRAVGGPDEKRFIDFLHDLYGRPAGRSESSAYVGALEPDLLGEALVAGVLGDTSTRKDFIESALQGAQEKAIENTFTVLGRIALGEEGRMEKWIESGLAQDIERRAYPAFRAAMALGEETALAPLGMALAKALERGGTVEVARRIEGEVPEYTVSLREVGVWATGTVLKWLPNKEDEEIISERARLLSNLGVRLSDIGRREEALEATREAVEHYRALAAKRPDAFLPYLAGSLNNLGMMLSELGRREEALEATREAVEIRRALAAKRPDAFLPDLATSLGASGSVLSAMGRHEEAAKAFHEGLQCIAPVLEKYPEALGRLAAALVSGYGEALEKSGGEADEALVRRVAAASGGKKA